MRWRMPVSLEHPALASNLRACSSSSCWISSTARSIVGREVTYSVAGQIARLSSRAKTSPESGSKCVICSTSSPKNETR